MSVIRLATEDERLRGVRAELARQLKLACSDVDRGEELDEPIAAARRACDDADKVVRGRRRRGRRWDAIVDEIYARAADPWVSLRIGSTELVNVRTGSYVALIGGEGSGKSSFALQLLAQHEREHGPVVYVTPELDADEAGGRAIGQDRGASWRDVLMGRVPREHVQPRPRLVILEREDATVSFLTDEVEMLRHEFPDQPILVGWDYLQASPGEQDGERMRVAKLSSQLRQLAKRLRIVLLVISQSSRDGAKKLDSGELVGAEAGRAGAESSQIERDAYATITVGDKQPREDGTEGRSVSIGKYRMGAGDIVYAAVYEGRTGWWRLEHEAQTATKVRDERKGRAESGKVAAAELAMMQAAEKSPNPLTRDQLSQVAATKADYARKAIANLIARGELVEVARKVAKAKYFMLWTPGQAAAHNVALVPTQEVLS